MGRLLILLRVRRILWLLLGSLETLLLPRTWIACVLGLELTSTKASRLRRIVAKLLSAVWLLLALLVRLRILRRAGTGTVAPSQVGIRCRIHQVSLKTKGKEMKCMGV